LNGLNVNTRTGDALRQRTHESEDRSKKVIHL
jgi:hypothetical protein